MDKYIVVYLSIYAAFGFDKNIGRYMQFKHNDTELGVAKFTFRYQGDLQSF